MEKHHQKLEIIAYTLVIAMTIFTGAFIAYSYLSTPSQRAIKIEKGDILPALDEDIGNYNKTLVLALSTKCKFCSESATFYQSLVSQLRQSDKIKIIAVFPQQKQESENYLSKIDVKIDTIKQVKLDDFKVEGTPTIILLDQDHKVVNSWVGKLNEQSQTEVLNAISEL